MTVSPPSRATVFRQRTFVVVAAVTSVMLSFAGRARAFCRTTTVAAPPDFRNCAQLGAPLFWRNACVGVSYQKTDGRKLRTEELATHLNEAFATWTGVTCRGGGHPSIAVKELAPTASTEIAYHSNAPNVNLVIMRDDSWSFAGELTMPTTAFNADTGEILDVDIELDTKDHDFTLSGPVPPDGYDLQSILLHTAGTFFGLGPSADPTSVMYGRGYTPGTVRRSLSVDDIDGICEIYPPDGTRKVFDGKVVVAAPCDPTPPNGLDVGRSNAGSSSDDGCAAAPQTPATGALVITALTALTLAGVRRRRHSSKASRT